MLKDRPTPPNGYHLVDDGKVRKDDFVWDIEEKVWIHPKKYDYECLGADVADYYATSRKAK